MGPFARSTTLLSFFFSLYFAVYAASPLTFTFAADNVDQRTRCTGETSPSKCLHLFFLDLLCSGLSGEKDTKNADSNSKVLLRKFRAVISEDSSAKMKAAEAALGADTPFSLSAYPAFLATVSLDSQELHRGHHVLYSGPSPPFSPQV